MISLYSGTPRSGKSLHAAERIIAWSRRGFPVIANFECNLTRYKKAKFTYCPNGELTPEFLISFSRNYFGDQRPREREFLLVIDECQLLFNSLDTRRKNRFDWISFFTLHGKLGYDVILIAQNDRMIDRQIRGLIEYEYIHRKLANFGLRGLLLRCFTFGAGFIVVQRWYPIKEKIGQEFFRARKPVYSIYDTFTMFDKNDIKKIEASPENLPEKPSEVQTATKRPKQGILLRSLLRQFSTLPRRCQGSRRWRRGRYSRPWYRARWLVRLWRRCSGLLYDVLVIGGFAGAFLVLWFHLFA